MKTRYLSIGAVLLLAAMAAGALYAGKSEPWKDKPFDQWTDKDIQMVFTDSPWAETVTVEATWKPLSAADVNSAPGGSVEGVGNQGPTNPGRVTALSTPGPSTGGKGSSQGSGSILPSEHDPNALTRGQNASFNVYWMSSRTMRGAVARKAELHAGSDPKAASEYVAEAQDEFQVAVQGADMAPFQRMDEKKYQELAWLQVKKGKHEIMPSHVVYRKDDHGIVTAAVFYFPKKDASGEIVLGPDTKGVEFVCKVASSAIHAAFDPSKMVDMKGPDL
jgi:hypothetical protein